MTDSVTGRLLYEYSVPFRGYLIIPFVAKILCGQALYSYRLLSEWGQRGQFHKAENPAGLYSESSRGILEIAIEHLDRHSDISHDSDYFKYRYTFHQSLIIVFEGGGRCFYDHYLPYELSNIAAPKLFRNRFECLRWIKQGANRNSPGSSLTESDSR